MNKPLLVVDFIHTGHHSLHMRHFVRYGLGTSSPVPIRFLITKALLDRTLGTLSEPEKKRLLDCVELLDDDPLWVKLNQLFSRQTLACWIYFEVLNLRRRKERILLVYLESLFYGLALFPLPRFDVSGLLFRPTFYYRKRGMLDPGLSSMALFALKWISSLACRLRPGIRRVFTLDPLAEEYGRSVWKTDKFLCLPDPLGPEPGMERPIATVHSGPKAELNILLAGALSPRKGLKETVDALAFMPPEVRRKIVTTVIGQPDKDAGQYVTDNLARLRSLGVRLNEALRFVSDQEMDDAIAATDVVLVPYRGFKGSSGMVIRAAHFGKPVISTDEGVMAYFVKTHGLGAAIDVGSPNLFAACLGDFLERGFMQGFNPTGARQYADDSEPQLYVAKIFGLEQAADR